MARNSNGRGRTMNFLLHPLILVTFFPLVGVLIILFLKPDQINVKATRGEGLGFVGREEGVKCYAVALLEKK